MPVKHPRAILTIVAFAMIVFATDAVAQHAQVGSRPTWADSSSARIMSLVRKNAPVDVFSEIFRGQHKAYPTSKSRELLDSVTIAAIHRPDVARDLVLVLTQAGSVDPTLVGSPNPDALDRLIQIHRAATSADARHAALRSLIGQDRPARAFPELRAAAAGSDAQEAFYAVASLGEFAFVPSAQRSQGDRDEARALLHELLDRKLVKKGPAASQLCEFAIRQKWSTAGQCAGMM